MPEVRADDPKVLAVATSDLHFRLTPPKSRAEPDWMKVQHDTMREIAAHCRIHKCPLIVAGDVFDDGWRDNGRVTPGLVNWVINVFRAFKHGVFAVPGQHDLPNHRYGLVKDSAYWTLVEAGVVTNLGPGDEARIGRYDEETPLAHLWGVPWGQAIPSPLMAGTARDGFDPLHIAVIHAYCHEGGETMHKGAKDEEYCSVWRGKLVDFDVAVFGDNHRPFVREARGKYPTVYNTGGPLNRNSDEKKIDRSVGLIMSDGSVKLRRIMTPEAWKDKAEEIVAREASLIDADEFVRELNETGKAVYDFVRSCRRYMKAAGVDEDAMNFITGVLAKLRKGRE